MMDAKDIQILEENQRARQRSWQDKLFRLSPTATYKISRKRQREMERRLARHRAHEVETTFCKQDFRINRLERKIDEIRTEAVHRAELDRLDKRLRIEENRSDGLAIRLRNVEAHITEDASA